MNLWWAQAPLPGNVGDLLGPYLFEKMTGRRPLRSGSGPGVVFSVGSVAKFATADSIVWGTGTMRESDPLDPRANWLAVRGPLTRDVVLRDGGDCPEVYGDPGLLVPRVFWPELPEQKTPVGIVPHYIDFERVVAVATPGVCVISPLHADVEVVIREIVSCERIVSSSLHGLILAHAYGIPARWALFSDGVQGDGFKFRDYFASADTEQDPLDLREARWTRDDLLEGFPLDLPSIDLNPLLDACPW